MDYYGCLLISVTRSSELYRAITGWAHGVMAAKRLRTPNKVRGSAVGASR